MFDIFEAARRRGPMWMVKTVTRSLCLPRSSGDSALDCTGQSGHGTLRRENIQQSTNKHDLRPGRSVSAERRFTCDLYIMQLHEVDNRYLTSNKRHELFNVICIANV